MATNPPSFFNPESISYDQYSKGPVNFYNQALDTSSLAGTGIGVTNPDDITDLKQYGIAGPTNRVEDQGDTQDDALNALDDTSIQGDNVGGSMFPGGTGIEYNNFNAWDKYDSYQSYLEGERPPGTQDRWSTEAGSKSLADRVGADRKDAKFDGKTAVKGATLASGNFIMAGLGSVLTTTTTVQNAFGNIGPRPEGALGFLTDKFHERQYGDMAHNRAVARAFGVETAAFQQSVDSINPADRFQERGFAPVQGDIGFAMSFGSGTGASGITRRAGTATYTGNLRGMDFGTLKNIEAVQRGFVPSTFNRGFGFDYSGKGAMTFEDAGYSGPLSGGGRYTSTGSYMDAYGRTSMMGNASHLESYSSKWSSLGLSKQDAIAKAAAVLADARKGNGKLKDLELKSLNGIKAAKAAKAQSQAAADRQASAAAEKARAEQMIRDTYLNMSGDDGGGGDTGFDNDDVDTGSSFSGGMSEMEASEDNMAYGGKVPGYAMGTPPPGVQASQSGFVDRPPSQVSEAGKVADDRPMQAKEGTYVINAAAVEFAGEQDIRKMIMDAQKEAVRRGLSTGDFERHSDLVDIAVSRGEVTVAPHLVDIIGEDRLEKINKRGIRKTEERIAENGQEPVGAAGGGFITRKKFHSGGGVHPHSVKAAVGISGTSERGITSEEVEVKQSQEEQFKRKSATPNFKSKAEEELYNQGVQFGDTEVFADILGKTNFNKLIQAAARDSRTLSDTVTTLRPGENMANPLYFSAMGLYNQRGRDPYTPVYLSEDSLDDKTYRTNVSNSGIVMQSPARFGGTSSDYIKSTMAYTATLAHELMHKGADILANDPNFNPTRSLVAMQKLFSQLPNITKYIDSEIDFETYRKASDEKRTSGDAEHRYIASVIGQAYLRRNMESVRGAFEKSQKPPKGSGDSFGKLTGSDLVNEAKQNILYETRRVFENYLAPIHKEKFLEENDMFRIDPEYDSLDFKDGSAFHRQDVNKIPFEELAAAYDSINRIMAEDYAAVLFKNAVVDKPVNIPRRKNSPKPSPAKAPLQDATGAAVGSQPAPEQKYERGFLDKMLGVTPAY